MPVSVGDVPLAEREKFVDDSLVVSGVVVVRGLTIHNNKNAKNYSTGSHSPRAPVNISTTQKQILNKLNERIISQVLAVSSLSFSLASIIRNDQSVSESIKQSKYQSAIKCQTYTSSQTELAMPKMNKMW